MPAQRPKSDWRLNVLSAGSIAAFLLQAAVAFFAAQVAYEQLSLLHGERDLFFVETALSGLTADAAELVTWDRIGVIAAALTFVPLFTLLYAGLPSPRRRIRWAWLGWLVPFVQLYMPYRLAIEVDDRSRGRAVRGRASWLVFTWWTCWLLGRLGGLVAGLAGRNGRVESAIVLDLGSAVASAVAALCGAALVVRWVFRTKATGDSSPPEACRRDSEPADPTSSRMTAGIAQ